MVNILKPWGWEKASSGDGTEDDPWVSEVSISMADFFSVFSFFQSCDIVPAFAPTDIDTDADGDWVDVSEYTGCLVVLFKAAGTAGDDPSIRLLQATSTAGAGAKDLTFTSLRYKIATSLATQGNWTVANLNATADLDLATPVDYGSDNKQGLFVVDIASEDLDTDNDFKYIQLSIEGDDLGNPQYGAGLYILYGRLVPSAEPPNAID